MTLPCTAVLFDFDGVIVESNAIKLTAFLALYSGSGRDVEHAIADFYHRNGGLPRERMLHHFDQVLLGRPRDDARVREMALRVGAMVEDAVSACPEVPGALSFIRRHSAARPLFIASGTPEPELRRIVDRRGWSPLFAEVAGSPRHKTDVVADLIARHRLEASRSVFVGDALTDLEAAEANGLAFIGIVRPGAENVFPPGTRIEPDLAALDTAIMDAVGFSN
ncbi:HAD family hydrolase [Azospirillum picis]|uniref:phosphoglycolate phosphatase n=1 Tax=Azospirillum picis TaxID=488438 RepID=A0ABU0MSV7_9PROT|nr:HAD family hydrolase [Azospirillum picis]MBP2302762.1 phosphoglycolate phosphatase-like HAD superfamily hydrolase [Azospirillum picis]MDQ0536576.1 phosphoglycolate phosphatase-like HAD superfamily hydrolase [Azospirillum picis]